MHKQTILSPEELVRELTKAMFEWEAWACEQEDLIDAGKLDDIDVTQSIKEKYEAIIDKFAIAKTACKGMCYGDPPDYHPTQQIVAVEVNKDRAVVTVHNDPDTPCISPDDAIVFRLKLTDKGWRVTSRKLVSEDGDVVDVGV